VSAGSNERIATAGREPDPARAEAKQFEACFNHAAVGMALGEHWKFPAAIQRVIAHHHAPEQDELGDLPCVVHVADAIVHGLDLAGAENDMVPALSERAWSSLGPERPLLHQVFRNTEAAFEQTCQALNV